LIGVFQVRGEKYELGRVLGKGSFGKVFVLLRRDKGDAKMFAMKQIDKQLILQKRVVRNIISEMTILADLGPKAPFVIHLLKTFQVFKEDRYARKEQHLTFI